MQVRRVTLFVLTNLAVLTLLAITVSVLGLDRWLAQTGIRLPILLAFSAVFGFGGALISLLMSKRMAMWSTGAKVITSPTTEAEAWLVATVTEQARGVGIGVPDVAIYDSAEPNAFATGARRDAALVAVSTGLLETMDRTEVEAVLAHEVAHVANGDMVTMTLLQGVLNTFVVALSQLVGYAAGRAMASDDDDSPSPIAGFAATLLSQVFFGALASLIVMAFSRHREYRADAGAANMVGAPAMISALERLRGDGQPSAEALPESVAAMGIRPRPSGWLALMASHPPIDARIEALRRRPVSNGTGTASMTPLA